MRRSLLCFLFLLALVLISAEPAPECNILECYATVSAPIFSDVPSDVVLDCAQDPTAISNSGAPPTATDACGNAVDVTTDVAYNVLCDMLEIQRTFVAIDRCGNSNVVTQIITVRDQISPQVQAPAAAALTLDESCTVDDSVAALGRAVITDNCDLAPVVEIKDTVTPGSCTGTYTTVIWHHFFIPLNLIGP